MREITMSSVCYEATTIGGVENGEIPASSTRRRGRGRQHFWPYSPELLADLRVRVSDVLEMSSGFDDEEASRDRTAMKVWLERNSS